MIYYAEQSAQCVAWKQVSYVTVLPFTYYVTITQVLTL